MEDSTKLGLELLEELNEKNKKTNICKGCKLYNEFKKKCWFYWEDKKFCSQHTSNGND